MKQTFYLVILSLILVATSCSDTSDVDEFAQDEANLVANISQDIHHNTRAGGNPFIVDLTPYCDIDLRFELGFTKFEVHFVPDLSEEQKIEVRLRHLSKIECVDVNYMPDNTDIELWKVKDKDCSVVINCKPKNQKPEDPDIEDATEK